MRSLLFVFSFSVLLFTSCANEDPLAADTTVPGSSWELKRALRNNMETATLDGLFYEFKEDGTLVTNLMGNEQDGTYTIDGTEIATTGVDLPLTYEITELTDTTLHLQSRYQGYQFNFELGKSE